MRDEKEKDSEALMHFEIPYNWKGTLRGLFWINVGGYALFLAIITIFLIFHKIGLNGETITGIIIGLSIFTAFYLLIRYATIKYDRIKEPIRIWIKDDHLEYKRHQHAIQGFRDISKIEVTINDKVAKLETWYTQMKPNGDTGWIYKLQRLDVEKGKYKYYVEKYWIPSMKLIIQQIKKYNPGVEVEWQDVRKKYR